MSDNAEFMERHALWRDCLNGDDSHAVIKQLLPMVWNLAAYRTINEARGLAPEAEEGGVQLNGLLHTLLDDCFWDNQLIAVRKLVDKSSPLVHPGKRNDRSVYSLGALLQDMQSHRHLISRANYFACNEITYGEPPTEDNFLQIRELHNWFDELSGVSPKDRSADDLVMPEVFQALMARMDAACAEIATYATKFRAHAATPGSRATMDADAIQLNREKLGHAHDCLCRIHQFLCVYFFNHSHYS